MNTSQLVRLHSNVRSQSMDTGSLIAQILRRDRIVRTSTELSPVNHKFIAHIDTYPIPAIASSDS